MARFTKISETDFMQLLDAADSKNTKKAIMYSERIFYAFLQAEGFAFNAVARQTPEEINQHLKKFYASARSQKGDLYSKRTMISIRYGLQKSFEKSIKLDIVNNNNFKEANCVFAAMLKKLKQEGKGNTEHKEPINKEDLTKLYQYLDNKCSTPMGLQNKVFVDFMLYFCNRGRENLRCLKREDFKFCGDKESRYIIMKDMKTKNHSGDTKDNDDSQGGRMYEIPDNPRCPLKSFVLYLSHLHPDCEMFWQRPKAQMKDDVWYGNVPVSVNTLGNKMKMLSSAAGLSHSYTNHCLRATAVTILDKKGFEARHIMTVSNHRSETSIKNYSRTDEGHKRKMSTVISDAVTEDSVVTKKNKTDEKTRQDHEQEQGFDDDISDLDLLALTESQEIQLLRDISASTVNHSAFPNCITIPKHSSQQNVFNFSNVGTVRCNFDFVAVGASRFYC